MSEKFTYRVRYIVLKALSPCMDVQALGLIAQVSHLGKLFTRTKSNFKINYLVQWFSVISMTDETTNFGMKIL